VLLITLEPMNTATILGCHGQIVPNEETLLSKNTVRGFFPEHAFVSSRFSSCGL